MGRPLHILISIQGIEACFMMMNKNCKKDIKNNFITQAFYLNGRTVIDIKVNKEDIYILRTQLSSIKFVTES